MQYSGLMQALMRKIILFLYQITQVYGHRLQREHFPITELK